MKTSSPALLTGFEGGKPGAGKPGAAESAEEGTGALAGKALASALKSGDGQAVYDAFAALMRECDEAAGEEKDPEPEPEAPTAA